MNSQQDYIVIYTDGGATPNPGLGGWAAILIFPDETCRELTMHGAVPDTTNNRMELMAVIKALEILKEPYVIQVYTDSTYLKNAFSGNWVEKWIKNDWKTAAGNPVLNKDLWQKLLSLAQLHSIDWIWTKAHASDALNNHWK
jgi:ribonuclease HI